MAGGRLVVLVVLPVMMPWSKAKPWPYWMRIGDVGLMLREGQDGQMVGRAIKKLTNVTPTTYDFGELSPYREHPYVFGPLSGGVGESVQTTASARRYKYAKRADLSIFGERRPGPYFHAQQLAPPGSGQFVNQLTLGRHNSTDVLFAMVGGYVYRNDGTGNWILSRDSGGAQHIQGVQFKGSAGSDRFWVTTDAGDLWGYDGTVWAQAVLPVGAKAVFVEKVGTELHIFSTNEVRVCTAGDPMLALSWGGVIYVGDYGKNATWMRALDEKVFYFKDDGIFTITVDAFDIVQVNDLFPEMRHVVGPWRGRNAQPWRGYLWFAFGDSFYRLSGDASLDPIGPERIVGLDDRLINAPIAFDGHESWFGYLVTGQDLWKFGEWAPTSSGRPVYQFLEEWNASLADWPYKTPSSIFVTDVVGGVPRLFIGFDDGSVEYTRLPASGPDPATDPACEFVNGGLGEESYIEWPDHNGLAEADQKHWRAFSVTGPVIDSSHYVEISFRTDPNASWSEVGTRFTASGQRVNVPGDAAGYIVQVRENLHGLRSSALRVESVVLHEQTRPELLLEFDVTAIAGNHVPRRDGAVDRRTAQQIRAALRATAGPGSITVIFPDGTAEDVDFVDFGETLRPAPKRWGAEWDVPLTLVQFRGNTVYGTVGRMLPYTVSEFGAFSVEQFGRL